MHASGDHHLTALEILHKNKISAAICHLTDMGKTMETELMAIRECYKAGKTKPEAWRRSQLIGLQTFLKENEMQIFRTLKQDLGKHHVEAFRDEIGPLKKSLNLALKDLKKWMSSKKAKLPIVAVLSHAELVPEPLGVVLGISTWNFPLALSLEPLIGAIAACTYLLLNSLPNYIDHEAIKVFEGGPIVGEQLLHHKWDKIFFTGSARIGRMIMSTAAKHLTPVTLELGGKYPAALDSHSCSWDIKAAINRIVGAKYGFCPGQSCVGIDYLLVEKTFLPTVLEMMKVLIKEMYGDNPRESRSVSSIINKHHFLRLKALLTDQMVKKTVVYGGSMDEDSLFIEPTILVDPALESEIVTEEVFGPLLPIITLDKIEDCVEFISTRPKTLAIYALTNNEVLRKRIISETSSGSVVFNDAVTQFVLDTIPFGGIGESGIGKYHGKFSFDTFSHYKAVCVRSLLVDFWFRSSME